MNELTLIDEKYIINNDEQYKKIVTNINQSLESALVDSKNFYKSHSQYMSALLDVTAITPIRRIKHILAEIDKTKRALEDAYFGMEKHKIKLKEKKLALDKETNHLKRELIEIEILEMEIQHKNSINSIQGAIRKLSFFVTQYNSVLKKIGKDSITEEDYEKEEDRYHIMTAVKQALCAARARGGSIDEGNHIYLFDMGLNGASVQRDILDYLMSEQEMIKKGLEPTYEMTMEFLEFCGDKYAGCAKKNAENRGYMLLDQNSLVNPHRITDK